MKAVIIGASDKSLLWRKGQVKKSEYKDFVRSYAEFLAEHFEDVIVTPDDGVYGDIARKFGELKGKKPVAFYPDQDENFGFEHLKKNFRYYEMRPIGGDWYKLNAELVTKAPVVICLGFSPGSMIELAYIKYHQKYGKKNIHLYIDERCIEGRLPKSFSEQINNLHYHSSLQGLKRALKRLKG